MVKHPISVTEFVHLPRDADEEATLELLAGAAGEAGYRLAEKAQRHPGKAGPIQLTLAVLAAQEVECTNGQCPGHGGGI